VASAAAALVAAVQAAVGKTIWTAKVNPFCFIGKSSQFGFQKFICLHQSMNSFGIVPFVIEANLVFEIFQT
jgi:hypothetical protein